MKKVYPLALFAGFLFTANAQEPFVCGTDEMNQKMLEAHPEIKMEQEKLEAWTREYTEKHANDKAGTVYTIPIVFHIVHNGGSENVSDAQVQSALDNLNKDFRKLNSDASQVVSQFKAISADCEIEFAIAKKDPNGNPTDGIDRIQSSTTNSGTDAAKLNPWPRDMYCNVWVVNYTSAGSGWTYFPSQVSSSSSADVDGIIIRDEYFGRTGTSYASSRIITHEIGHWLNLLHTFGYSWGACGDDQISDTPKTSGNQSCNKSNATCGSTDNVENYMDYTFCMKNFTEGQKTRMRAAITSSTADRNKLWQTSNLIATGVLDNTQVKEHIGKNLYLNVYPNPSSENATIEFQTIEKHQVSLELFDMTGKKINTLTSGTLADGYHRFAFNEERNLEKGIYFARLVIDNHQYSQKIIIN